MQTINFIRIYYLSLIIFAVLSKSFSDTNFKKVCQGTSLGLSHQKWTHERYQALYNRYVNCTHVDGNLELVFITDPSPDLSFLSDIKEVTGYVLIAISYLDYIPLTSLRVIRGRTLYHDSEAGMSNFYSLYVYLNFDPDNPLKVGLKELQFNSLHEIQSGSVFVQHNNRLCYGNEILWRDIVTGESSLIRTAEQHDLNHPYVDCEPCHESCGFNGTRFCWGRGPQNCQKLNRETCSKQCGGQCFGSLPNQCCDSECIGGCIGPSESQCWACKNFDDNGTCQKFCPPEFVYDPALFKQVPNPSFKFSYGTLCVDKCPEHLNSRQGACVQECGKGMIADENRRCVECNGTCPKECKFEHSYINAKNIVTFKDCTIVQGSIFIPDLSFQKDDYLRVPPLKVGDLFLLKDVKEVTGYVKIQANVPQLRNLSFLSNLQIIHGMKLDSIRSSLHVYKTNLEVLGLNSLKEIRNGAILVSNNSKLCHPDSVAWHKIVKQNKQKVVIKDNNPDCDQEGKVCHPECSSDGCWGPREDQCFSCRNYNFLIDGRTGIKCVLTCASLPGMYKSASQECKPCHEECFSNCTGPSSDQCDSCKRAKDGPYCVSECPKTKFLDEKGICRECHHNCGDDGCTGPLKFQGLHGCKSCKLPLLKWKDIGSLTPAPLNITTCLTPGSKCPSGFFMRIFKPACLECHPLCRECSGASLDECTECRSFRQGSTCTAECPSNYYESMEPHRHLPQSSVWNSSLNFQNRSLVLEPTCMLCDHNCLKCQGPTNRNCTHCRQYKVFIDELSVDPLDKEFYCTEKCPEQKPESIVINMETICQPIDAAARRRMWASISLVILISIVLSATIVLILCLKQQKAQNAIRKAKESMSKANTKEEIFLIKRSDSTMVPDMSSLIVIKSSELTIGAPIGSGAYGDVHKGIWRPIGKPPIEVAIKILKENSQELLDEARIMASVNHICCIKILCVSLSAELMLITPLMKLGCLLDYVRKNAVTISSREILLWSKQIAMGMEHLESRSIVHCDLAARNVLVDSTKQVKITDFGLAKLHLGKELQQISSENEDSIKMPVKWLAPESLKMKQFTHKSDVWSYGITVWELCTFGDRPYKQISHFRGVIRFLESGERLERPIICSQEFHGSLLECWSEDPELRPSFSSLAETMDFMLADPGKYIRILPEHRYPPASIHHQSIKMDQGPTTNDHHNHIKQNKDLNQQGYLAPESPILYKNLLLFRKPSSHASPYANVPFRKYPDEHYGPPDLNDLTYIPTISDLSHGYRNDFTPGFLDRPSRPSFHSAGSRSKSSFPHKISSPTLNDSLDFHKRIASDLNQEACGPVNYSEHDYYNELDFNST